MKKKYIFVAVMLTAILLAGTAMTGLYVRYGRGREDTSKFHVVTSFYPVYIAAENIIGGCEGVELQNLSEPQSGCMHDYQLTAQDMKLLSGADAFLVNGGGIENFLAEVAGQYPDLAIIHAWSGQDTEISDEQEMHEASDEHGVQKMHEASDEQEIQALSEENAHVWMSIPAYMIQVQALAEGLASADQAHSRIYRENCEAYLAKLRKLHVQQQEVARDAAGQGVIIFHEAFAYIARDYGLAVAGSIDLDEERQVSAGEVADVVRLIQEQDIHMILAEELYGKEMCETVKKEAEVQIVYLDTCVRGSYEPDSYLEAMQENLDKMRQVLTDASE